MKIHVATPVYRDPALHFVTSLLALQGHTLTQRPDIQLTISFHRCSVVSQARNRLLSEAVKAGADYILFIDSDQIFPADTLARLLSHGREIVGTNPALRSEPTGPTAANMENGKAVPVWTTREASAARTVERVDRIGFGLVLLKLSIVESARAAGEIGPLFHFRLSADGSELTGEDYYFCEVMERAGVPIYIDHALSWEVGHIHERVLYPADTELVRIVHKARGRAAR